MSDPKRTKQDETNGALDPLLQRRQLLALVGVGSLTLVASRAGGAQKAIPTPDCSVPIPCPDTAPDLPDPDLKYLPPIAQLVSVLAQFGEAPQKNRRNFNKCPDKFLQFYNLTPPDVAKFLDFKNEDIYLYIASGLPTPVSQHQPVWSAYNRLVVNTEAFWNGWDNYVPKDCYDADPFPKCKPEITKSYAKPKTKIDDFVKTSVGDQTKVDVYGQGFVKPITMDFIDMKGNVTPAGTVVPDSNSTFRCGCVTGQAKLEIGTSYFVRLTISGLVRTSTNSFVA